MFGKKAVTTSWRSDIYSHRHILQDVENAWEGSLLQVNRISDRVETDNGIQICEVYGI